MNELQPTVTSTAAIVTVAFANQLRFAKPKLGLHVVGENLLFDEPRDEEHWFAIPITPSLEYRMKRTAVPRLQSWAGD